MKKCIPHIVSLAAIAGFLAMARNHAPAQTTDPLLADSIDQSLFPQITAQPLDQVVQIGSNVVLSVEANNANACQWLKNGVPLKEQTNRTLIIPNAGMDDVGLYACQVFNGGPIAGAMVPTRMASVQVEMAGAPAATSSTSSMTANTLNANGVPGGGQITVMGTPLLGGGTQGSCPGSYIGYVHYSKSFAAGWGWTPVTGATPLAAADGSGRSDTKVQYIGLYGDYGCGQTTVTIPYPPLSPIYQFAIYFTNNVPTSTNYPLVLTGFNP